MKRLLFGLLLSLGFAAPAAAQDCASRLSGYLKADGYQSTEQSKCGSWIVTNALTIPKGDGETGDLLVIDFGEGAIIGAIIRTKARLPLSADLLGKLMYMNHKIIYAKVGIDDDGDLFVRQELPLANLDKNGFDQAVKNVVDASNQVYALLPN